MSSGDQFVYELYQGFIAHKFVNFNVTCVESAYNLVNKHDKMTASKYSLRVLDIMLALKVVLIEKLVQSDCVQLINYSVRFIGLPLIAETLDYAQL